MPQPAVYLQIHVNGNQTFFLNEKLLLKFSGKLRKIIKQEKRRNLGLIEIDDFPGGPEGFELISRFCYNKGTILITVSNVSLLHCCAIYFGMTERICSQNLLQQTENFLQEIFYWSWNDIITCLKSCESFFSIADSYGLLQKVMYALLAKIAQNSDLNLLTSNSSSSSISSPETSSSSRLLPCSSSSNCWWFEDLALFSPRMIDYFVKSLGSYGSENNSLVLTKFLLNYLKTAVQINDNINHPRSDYKGLAETTVHGVIYLGKNAFSCRGLFWVLRVVSGFGISKNCRFGLEKMIAEMLDHAKLDDILVSGSNDAGQGVYDVNLVVRLIRLFVHNDKVSLEKVKKVGKLMENYLREIAPDQSLKISKFLAVAESLPDCSRDCYDGIYRAIDIYLESHPCISLEERSRLCRCLNYEKLSLEACKDLAKNPRIPPRIAVEALASQTSSINIPSSSSSFPIQNSISKRNKLYNNSDDHHQVDFEEEEEEEENDEIKLNIQKMQWRVVELEKVCQDMKSQMSRIVKGRVMIAPPNSHNTRTLPRMC